VLAGISSATLSAPASDVPGSLFRVTLTDGPLTRGAGRTAWQFYAYDMIMEAADPSQVVASYPAANSPDWFVSGFALGAEELGGTAAEVDEPLGHGHTILFAAEPNFRALTDGTAKLLTNTITARLPVTAPAAQARTLSAAPQAADFPYAPAPIRLTVPAAEKEKAASVLTGFAAKWTEQPAANGAIRFVIDNPGALSADEHPWASKLPAALATAGVTPLAVVLP
jgi:hypothetical protein